jgi:hypothetical protein
VAQVEVGPLNLVLSNLHVSVRDADLSPHLKLPLVLRGSDATRRQPEKRHADPSFEASFRALQSHLSSPVRLERKTTSAIGSYPFDGGPHAA